MVPYYNLTPHEFSPSVVSALLNMVGVPASAICLYLLRCFIQIFQKVGVTAWAVVE